MKRIAVCISIAALSYLPVVQASSELLDSLRNGELSKAATLIKAGADANTAESNGTSALQWAVHRGDLALVNALIKAGADVNVQNNYGSSPVSEAAQLGNVKIMAALLSAGADPESPNTEGQTALMIVARSNNLETAKLLLENGADVNAREEWKHQTAVIWAAAQSQPEMLRLLIAAGGDPNSRSKLNERDRQVTAERRFQWRAAGGLTALMYAAREGCLECTQILVEAGADIDQGNAENVTALLTAIINLRFDTAKYLIQAGANIDKWSWRGENPVYSAVDVNTLPHGGYPDRPSTDQTSSLDILRILLETGANPNLQLKLQPTYRHLKDDRGADRMLNIGATPLLRAAKGHDVAAIELLFEHGVIADLPNREGTTPLMAAAGLNASSIDTRGEYLIPNVAENSKDTIAALIANGSDVNAKDRLGRTALHGAASWGWIQAVEYLADHGADLKATDNNGLTPLDYAMGRTSGAAGRGGGSDAHPQTAELIQNLLFKQDNNL